MATTDLLRSCDAAGMTDRRSEVISAAECFAQEQAAAAPAGHDWSHIDLVRKMALRIARDECADEFVAELAALLHEVEDAKAGSNEPTTEASVRTWLRNMSVEPTMTDHVARIVGSVPFCGAGVPDVPTTREGRCVRDADRLDAIGAIGIARTFSYGGSIGRAIHDPGLAPTSHATVDEYRSENTTTVNHFVEKLLLLRDRMETKLGRALADHRHNVMLKFLIELEHEWGGGA